MRSNDWVDVRLTGFGEELAGSGPVRVHEGAHEFTFTAGETQRVTRAFDWERVLKHVVIAGSQIFEVVPQKQEEPVAASAADEQSGGES